MASEINSKLKQTTGFEWDKGNSEKNLKKHGVTKDEAQEVFVNQQTMLLKAKAHSKKGESRYVILGKTNLKRLLVVVFTIRNKKIRVISARDMNKRKEYPRYKKALN